MRKTIKDISGTVSVLMLLLALTCITSWAQSTSQISGGVKDQSGAVLPGVEVTVTQTNTSLNRNTVTDETGSYVLTNLPIGPYRLEAALPGFRTYVQTGIVLQVAGNPVINAVLEVGQVTDQVEVQADAALVETRSTGVGQVMDNVRVLELPLNGRQVVELITLSGAAIGGADRGGSRGYPTDAISVAGGASDGLTYNLDGGTHNNPFDNMNMPLPFPDALQEFKVETSGISAQYGQHAAGMVNAVTKSGGNDFHGSLFEFVRNGVLNARNAFAVRRDSLKRNQFGGTIGGAIIENKLFFFAGVQTTIQRNATSDLRAFVPTAAMLAGDWSSITSPACNGGRQINLRPPFVNNRIDPALFSAPAVNLTKRLPSISSPCGEVRYGEAANEREHVVLGKVDYNASEKHSLFGRYQIHNQHQPGSFDGVNVVSLRAADYYKQPQSFVLGDTYLLGNGTVSSFRATLLRARLVRDSPDDYFTVSDLGVRNVYHSPQLKKHVQISVSGAFNVGSNTISPSYANSTAFQFAEDLSLVRGAHQVGIGANLIHSKLNVTQTTVSSGQFTFDATTTGLALGDFMLGNVARFRQMGINSHYWRQNYLALYLQDTWKANARLTINTGVRWEPYLSSKEKEGRIAHFDQSWFDRGIRSTIYKNAPVGLLFPGDPGIPGRSLLADEWLKFSPRVGLSWDPKGNGLLTVRAAYGLFYDYPWLYQFNGMMDEPPFGAQTGLDSPVGGFADPWQGFPGGNPFPAAKSFDVRFPLSGTFVVVPLEFKTASSNQWNLSVQKQVGTNWLVAANYLGSNVIHLLDDIEANPAIYLPGASCTIAGRTFSPCSSTSNTLERRQLSLQNPTEGPYYGNIVTASSDGTRTYNALLLSVQRRRSQGLTVQANYTWSHCIDDGRQNMVQVQGGEVRERRGLNRGNCETDRRHQFNVSTVYETPQFSNSALRVLGSGWRISEIVRIQSGPYLTVASGADVALSATTSDQRPNLVLASPYPDNQTLNQWINPAAFARPTVGAYGNFGCCNILGPGSIRIDMGLTRTFRIRENHSVEFRAEAFNMPNHVNPGNPNTNFSNQSFGRILSAADPRIMQLALKYIF